MPLPLQTLVIVALLGAVTGPIVALFLAVVADNKVSGFAIVKIMNTINLLPIAGYFIDMPWQLVAGIVPAYWAMKLVWLAAEGNAIMLFLVVGLIVNAAALFMLLRLFDARLHR